jgi:Winged helix DNA-binding domain
LVVGARELNRWTLARQLLLERVELDAVTAIERLAGMQAQNPPSPYVGLWSRLRGFRREELESAVLGGRVYKATLMRGTLHLVSEREFDVYRVACRHRNALLARAERLMAQLGGDAELLRAEIVARLRERPHSRAELLSALAHLVPNGMSSWLAFGLLHLNGATMNVAEDGRFDHRPGSRYRLAPPPEADPDSALRSVVAAYLRAFGPASKADVAQWLGQPIGVFGPALEELGPIALRAEGRTLYDLPDAPRPDPGVPAPVRFLPKWDNLLLAYERRERVLPDALRRTVIGKNGDVLATFLVDGVVAGSWSAPLRGRAEMTLTALARIPARARRAVEREGEALLRWLRPDAGTREVRWSED